MNPTSAALVSSLSAPKRPDRNRIQITDLPDLRPRAAAAVAQGPDEGKVGPRRRLQARSVSPSCPRDDRTRALLSENVATFAVRGVVRPPQPTPPLPLWPPPAQPPPSRGTISLSEIVGHLRHQPAVALMRPTRWAHLPTPWLRRMVRNTRWDRRSASRRRSASKELSVNGGCNSCFCNNQ